MTYDLKGSFKGNLNHIPIIIALGIIIGSGAYSTILGVFVLSVIMFLFNFKAPFIYSVTIPFGIILSFSNVLIGNAVFPLIFACSLFTIILAVLRIKKKELLKIPKAAGLGFTTGCFLSGLILGLLLMLENKVLPSVSLLNFSEIHFFDHINSNSIVTICVVFAVYYCLNKIKFEGIPSLFLAAFSGAIINYVYKMQLPSINLSYQTYGPYFIKNFPDGIIYFIVISLFLALIFITYTQTNLKVLNRKINSNKTLLELGFSNCICAFFGGVGGTISHSSSLDAVKNNDKPYMCLYSECIFLLPFVLFFKPISKFIPITVIGAILVIKCYEVLKDIFLYIKIKNKKFKIIFISCFLTCLYNIILGASISGIIALMTRKKQND